MKQHFKKEKSENSVCRPNQYLKLQVNKFVFKRATQTLSVLLRKNEELEV